MTLFLAAFTAFNVFLAYAAVRRALKLMTPEGRDWWQSKRLYAIACFAAWTLPLACVAATAVAWIEYQQGLEHWAGPMILAPLGWLVLMGIFFAIVDVSEDGVMDFGRGSKPKS
ncbi:MAG: hypothetical protein JNM47_13910 [Hyphomonadaceae bacterium]|nr:hypothetical protein [Hyphomonadaceae bacterium]